VPPAAELANGGFESGLAFWAVYHRGAVLQHNIERLSTGADPRAVLDGDASLRLIAEGTGGTVRSGAFQRVRVGAGRSLTFSASAYFKSGLLPGLVENRIREIFSLLRVGIDPAGGQSAESPNVVWSQRPGDGQWLAQSVNAVSVADYATVFVEAVVGDGSWSWPWTVVIFDGLTLTVR
jgi:hypothetical protein